MGAPELRQLRTGRAKEMRPAHITTATDNIKKLEKLQKLDWDLTSAAIHATGAYFPLLAAKVKIWAFRKSCDSFALPIFRSSP